VLDQVAALPGGGFAVFSELATENFVSLGIFGSSGGLVKNVAGTSVPTGLPRLSSLQVDSSGLLWVTTLNPAEVARFNQNGLLSVDTLAKPVVGYALALDQARGYVYVGGCAPLPGAVCLLVHQYAIDGMKYRKSFVETNPDVLRKAQFPIQWVPLDVDPRGIVWALDSPAFTLYSINPVSGHVASYPIRSRVAVPPGPVPPKGGFAEMAGYFRRSFLPGLVLVTRGRVVISIRRPAGAGDLLEVFNSAGAQVGVDVAAPGRLVGKDSNGGLFFGRSGENGPVLIEGVLSDSH
jgi:hypothetical protein